MNLNVEPKDIIDAYSTPIVQQTSFWSKVKEKLGMDSRAFEFSARNSELYTDVGGYSYTHADVIMFSSSSTARTTSPTFHTALRSSHQKPTRESFWRSYRKN